MADSKLAQVDQAFHKKITLSTDMLKNSEERAVVTEEMTRAGSGERSTQTRRPPSWWRLVSEYCFMSPVETRRNAPNWWSKHLPDDSLYEDDTNEKKIEKNNGKQRS